MQNIMDDSPKVIVIGIDGGTWELLKPLIEIDYLPNIKKLVKRGSYGNLESTVPPVTGPAWSSFVTGCTPLKHGVYDFVIEKSGKSKLATNKDIRYPTFYKILSDCGFRCVIIALPLSYPPSATNSIIFPDFFSPSLYIYPKCAKKYIKNYRLTPDMNKKGEELIEELIKFEKEHMESAKEMFFNEKWDLFFIHFITSDIVSHRYFGDMLRHTNIGKSALRVFKNIDNCIGWFVKNKPKNSIIVILSDHGFGEYSKTFYINTWLEKKGYLQKKTISGHGPKEVFDITDRRKEIKIGGILFKILKTRGIRKLARSIFSFFFAKKYRVRSGYEIDIENSMFYVPRVTSFAIYTNLNKYDAHKLHRLYQELEDIKDKSGRKIFSCLFRTNKIENRYPAIMFVPENDYFISTALEDHLFSEDIRFNFHKQDGIVLFYGPGIRRNIEIKNAKIYDVIPTIFYILGVEVPPYMDGKVLTTIFEENSIFRKDTIRIENIIEKIKLEEKIKTLKNNKKL